jgi:hypothetical protein
MPLPSSLRVARRLPCLAVSACRTARVPYDALRARSFSQCVRMRQARTRPHPAPRAR